MTDMRINKIKFKASQIKFNMKRRMDEIKGQRLIEGFYYYLNPEKIEEDKNMPSRGWLMMAHEQPGGASR